MVDNPGEFDFDIDLEEEVTTESKGDETTSNTPSGNEDDLSFDIDLSTTFVDSQEGDPPNEEGADDNTKEELSTEDKYALKKILEKVTAGFQVKPEELELLTRGGYQWFIPERNRNGKVTNWKQTVDDVAKYLNEVQNNFPTWDKVEDELNAGGGIVFGKDMQKIERQRWLETHETTLQSMAINPENSPRVFNGQFDQFGLKQDQDPKDWVYIESDMGQRMVNKNDNMYFPHHKQWAAEDEYFQTGQIPTGYEGEAGVGTPWDPAFDDINKQTHYWSSTDSKYKLNPEIALTEKRGWNPSQLPMGDFEEVVKAANRFNQSTDLFKGSRNTVEEDVEYNMEKRNVSPIVFKDGVMISNIHSADSEGYTSGTLGEIKSGVFMNEKNLLDYELIKQIMFSAEPYKEIVSLGYNNPQAQQALEEWGFTQEAMEDWKGDADDNLLFIFPWGTSMRGGGLTKVGEDKMNDYIGQYINTSPQFETARKLIEKEQATTLEYENFNEKLNTLPEQNIDYDFAKEKLTLKGIMKKYNVDYFEAEKILQQNKTYGFPSLAGTPGFSDIMSFQELLSNDQDTKRKVKARQMQFDHLANVMKGNLPENWDQWTADELIKNIKNAPSSEDRVQATRAYKQWLNDNYGGYFTDNIDAGYSSDRLDEFQLLFDPNTNNFINYKTATAEQKEEWLPAEEYINTLMNQGVIPTNKNQMLELMLDKEFQMVALAKQIFGQEKETTSQIGFGTAIMQGMFVEGDVPDEFIQIRNIAEKGELIRNEYERIEGIYNLPAVNRWNQLVKDFTVLSKAYYMNYDPTTIEKEGFFGGVAQGTSAIVGFDYSSQIDESKAVANALQEIGVEFTSQQLDALYTPTTMNNIGYGTPGFVMMAGEFALTSWATGGLGLLGMSQKFARVPYMLRNMAQVDKYGKLGLAGYSKFGKVYTDYMGATINNMAQISIRNGWTGALYDAEYLNPVFGLAAGPGGKLIDDFSKWQLSGKSTFWNEVGVLQKQLPGANLVGGAANVVSKGVTSTGLMTGGELAVIGWETAVGDISVEEAHDRLHTTLDPGHLFEVFSQCLILSNMNPIKSVREIKSRAEADINILTKGKYQRKQYAKKLDADYDYIFEEGIGVDEQNARIKLAKENMVNKEGGMSDAAYNPIKKAADVLGIDFFAYNKVGGWENFNLETFNKTWNQIVTEKGANNITNEQYAAARTIKQALEMDMGKSIETTSKIDMSAKELESQVILDAMRYEFENKLNPGLKMLDYVDMFAQRREKKLNYNAADIEVLGSLSKTQLEMILGENPTMTRVTISIEGKNIEVARKIVAQRNNKGFKPGSKLGNAYVEAAWQKVELERKQKDLAKDKGEDAGNFNENLEIFYEEKIAEQQAKMDKLEADNDVLLEEERQKNIELSKQEGNVEAYTKGTNFWLKMEKLGEVDAIIDLATNTQKQSLDVIDSKIKELQKENTKEADKSIEELKAQKAEILNEISIANLDVKGISLNVDGVPTTILNVEAMRRLKDVSASVHEGLHPYFNKILKGKNTNAFISEFKNQLSEYEYNTVLEKVKKHPDFKNGQNPNTIEWLNLYADALIKGELGWNGETMTGIGDILESKIRNESAAENAIIETPQDVYNFLRNVVLPNVEGGKVTKQVLEAMSTEVTSENAGSPALSAKETKSLEQELIDTQAAKQASIDGYLEAVNKEKKGEISFAEVEAIKEKHNTLMQQLNPMIKNMEANLTISKNNAENIEKIKSGQDAGDRAYKQLLADNEGIIGPVLNRWKSGTSKVEKGDWDAEVYAEVAKLVDTYDPSTGVPFGAYLRQNLARREGNMWNRLIEKDHDFFTEEINEATFTGYTSTMGDIDVSKRSEIVRPGGNKIGQVISKELGVDATKLLEADRLIKRTLLEIEPSKLNIKNIGAHLVEVDGKQVKLKDYLAKQLKEAMGDNPAERKAFFAKNWDMLQAWLPEFNMAMTADGKPITGDAIGIPNSVLKILYEAQGRADFVSTGKGKGTTIQKKTPKTWDEVVESMSDRNRKTFEDAVMSFIGSEMAVQRMNDLLSDKAVVEEVASKDASVAETMALESYLANLSFQINAGKASGLMSAEKTSMDNLSQELIAANPEFLNVHKRMEVVGSYLRAKAKGPEALEKWENANIDVANAIQLGMQTKVQQEAEYKEIVKSANQFKEVLNNEFAGDGEITLPSGETISYKEIRQEIKKVQPSIIGTKKIDGVSYKTVKEDLLNTQLENLNDLRAFFPKWLAEKQGSVMDAWLGEGYSTSGGGRHQDLINYETGGPLAEGTLMNLEHRTKDGQNVNIDKIPFSRQKYGIENQGTNKAANEIWKGLEQRWDKLIPLAKKKKMFEIQQKMFEEGASVEEVQKELSKLFTAEENVLRQDIYDAVQLSRKAWLESSTSKEQYLSRLKTLWQIGAANTNLEKGDRQWMASEWIQIDPNIDFSKERAKLEHGLPQVGASGKMGRSFTEPYDVFKSNLKENRLTYKGAYGTESGFNVVDARGTKTNMSGLLNRLQAYHENPQSFYNVKTGQRLDKYMIDKTIADYVGKEIGQEISVGDLYDSTVRSAFRDLSNAKTNEARIVALTKIENGFRNLEANKTVIKDIKKEVNTTTLNTETGVFEVNTKTQGTKSEFAKNLSAELKNSDLTKEEVIEVNQNLIKMNHASTNIAKSVENKKASVFDGDEVLWIHDVKIGYTLPNGKTGWLSNTEFNKQQKKLEKKGATWNFENFNNLEGATEGPLLNEFLKRIQESPSDVFISTARANNPQIRGEIVKYVNKVGAEKYGKDWKGFKEDQLDTVEGTMDQGGESLKVINSLVSLKTGEKNGITYNEVDFFDDNAPTTKHWAHAQREMNLGGTVYTVVHNSSKGQMSAEVAKEKGILFELGPDKALNLMIQDQAGIKAEQVFSKVKAQLRGKNKRKFRLLPDNAQDFIGLCYAFCGKGKKGDAQIEFINETITKGITLAEGVIEKESLRIGKDYKALEKAYPGISKNLTKKIEWDALKDFTVEDAIRIHTWKSQGMEVEGISKTDLANIEKWMEGNPEAKAFSEELLGLTQIGSYNGGTYQDLLTGSIWSDLAKTVDKDIRNFYMQGVVNNLDLMFSEANMNKLEAAYGPKYRAAMEDHIQSIKTGRNTAYELGPIDTKTYNFVNNANGALMTLNFRSATLQLTSAFNYINWSDNNMAKAGLAFANQPQYWKDFSYLWNQLEGRRAGNKLNIAESEIAEALKGGKQNKGQAMISYLISKGYAPTRIADSFAIAFGGASFYRNRINSLMKKGMSREMAEEQALVDWRDATESHQQSRRTDKLSPIQRTLKGRIMLGFHTTQMQYARLIDKSIKDLKNNRGNPVMNISRIINYGAIQPAVFAGLQTGAFMMLFQDESEEGRSKKMKEVFEGIGGSLVEGTGTWGVVANTAYHAVDTYYKEKEKEGTFPGPQYYKAALELLRMSPSLGGKVKMGLSASYDLMYKDDTKTYKIYDPESPEASATLKVIQMVTNLPTKELHDVYKSMWEIGVQFIGEGASEMDAIKVAAIALGWPSWQLESEIDKKKRQSKEKTEKAIRKKAQKGEVEIEDNLDINLDDINLDETLDIDLD